MAPSRNPPAEGIPYYTPLQSPPPGTALSPSPSTPTLFTPLRIRSLTLPHRIAVAPMCMYSSPSGHFTDFHLAHHGGMALRGAALILTEATAVQPNGRITPWDAGLWSDDQVPGLKRVVDLVHGLGQKIGVQLAHAGRKASTMHPWYIAPQTPGSWDPKPKPGESAAPSRASEVAREEDGGWADDVVGPSSIPFAEEGYVVPRALTVEEIRQFVQDFAAAAKRAVAAGVDLIEIHAAHGYLITEFLSPLSNLRNDRYGGSFENRTRLLKEVIAAVRGSVPETMPVFIRVSATEWADGGWDVPDTIALAKQLHGLRVDLMDISSGGNSYHQEIPVTDREFQTKIAGQIRRELRKDGNPLLIGAVGLITTAEVAQDLVQQTQEEQQGEEGPKADVVFIGRQFLREPEWVLRVAHRLAVEVKWANQYHRAVWKKSAHI